LYHAIQSPIPLINANFSYDIQRPKQVVTHDLLKIKGYLENNWGVWNLTYAFQHNFRQEYDIMRVDNGKAQLNLTLNTQNIGINFNHKKLGYFTGQMGIDGQYQHNTFRDGDRVFIPSYYSYSAAAYMIERYSKNKWTAEAGVRYDYKHFEMYNPEGAQLINVRYLFDYRNPSATLAFKYQINTKWEVSSTLSNAWRAPQAPELFSAGLHQGGARIELGNRNLSPEKSYSINLSSKYEIANKLKIETSLYTQSIQNFIYLKPGQDMLTIKGYYKTFNYTQINALLYGNDFLAEYFINKHWNVQTSMALVRAWDKSEHTWLILMPSDRFNLGGKFQSDISKTLQEAFVGINTQYVLQQKRIPVNFDQIDYPRPPAAYLLLNAEAGMKINLRKQALFFSITASNLFNTKYRDYMDIFRYFLDQAGTNFIVRFRVPFN
jgi:iron complex outermembrane receptor protein